MKKEAKTVRKIYSITQRHVDYIEHFLAEKGMLSGSDVVRQAIAYFHDKTFPDYVYRETAAGVEKKQKQEAVKSFKEMTDEQYCEQELKAPIYQNRDGIWYVVVHTIGNSLTAHKMDGIKEYMTKNHIERDYHLKKLTETSIEEMLTTYAKGLLEKNYGIIIGE